MGRRRFPIYNLVTTHSFLSHDAGIFINSLTIMKMYEIILLWNDFILLDNAFGVSWGDPLA